MLRGIRRAGISRITSRPQRAATTVEVRGEVKQCRLPIISTNLPVVVSILALARWAHVNVTSFLSNVKSSRLNLPLSRFDLSITRTCGSIFLSLTSQLRLRLLNLRPYRQASDSGS